MSDLTKTSKALFYDLVNSANAALASNPLSDSNVTLSVPTDGTFGDKNTQVTITAIAEEGYKGSVDVTYDRLDIGTLFSDASITPTVEGDGFADAAALLSAINSQYGLNLSADDIQNDDLSAQTYPSTYTLTIAAGSLAYIGTVDVSLPGVQTDLNSAVTTTALDGLTPPSGGITEA